MEDSEYKMEQNCVLCGRYIKTEDGEGLHFPCYWGCDEPLKTLRQTKKDSPVCIDCLPHRFKVGNAHWNPILSAKDLPKVGEKLLPNTKCIPSVKVK